MAHSRKGPGRELAVGGPRMLLKWILMLAFCAAASAAASAQPSGPGGLFESLGRWSFERWARPAAAPRSGAGAHSPNVLFVFIDTLRADHVSCYGYGRPTTPNLDALARRGLRFSRAFAQGNASLPSYGTLFTSLYPPGHGLLTTGRSLSPSLTTLPEVLRAHGFDTAAFVGGGQLTADFGLDKGFGVYRSPVALDSLAHSVPPALAWLDSRQNSRPFFLMVHGYDCHSPYRPPLGLRELYDPDYDGPVHRPEMDRPGTIDDIVGLTFDPANEAALQENPGLRLPWDAVRWRQLLPSTAGAAAPAPPAAPSPERASPCEESEGNGRPGALPYRLPHAWQQLSPADARHLVAHYDGAITYADTWLGVLLEGLRARGLNDRTLVIVAGDHGESLGERRPARAEDGRFGHGWRLLDCQLHVPLVAAGPGVVPGGVSTAPVGLIDLAPTVLELCGVPPCHQFQGRSLATVLRGLRPPPELADRPIFSAAASEASLRTVRWRLLLMEGPEDAGRGWRMHDLDADPGELTDVQDVHPRIAARLKSTLLDWLEPVRGTALPAGTRSGDGRVQLMRTFGYW